jgi:hypothetical protein
MPFHEQVSSTERRCIPFASIDLFGVGSGAELLETWRVRNQTPLNPR